MQKRWSEERKNPPYVSAVAYNRGTPVSSQSNYMLVKFDLDSILWTRPLALSCYVRTDRKTRDVIGHFDSWNAVHLWLVIIEIENVINSSKSTYILISMHYFSMTSTLSRIFVDFDRDSDYRIDVIEIHNASTSMPRRKSEHLASGPYEPSRRPRMMQEIGVWLFLMWLHKPLIGWR